MAHYRCIAWRMVGRSARLGSEKRTLTEEATESSVCLITDKYQRMFVHLRLNGSEQTPSFLRHPKPKTSLMQTFASKITSISYRAEQLNVKDKIA